MIIKYKNKVCAGMPLMVILSEFDRTNLANMAEDATKYAQVPDDWTEDQAKEWMKVPDNIPVKHEVVYAKSEQGDWEALYVDGELIEQGHNLGEGYAVKFWMDVTNKYCLTYDELCHCTVYDDNFPQKLEDMTAYDRSLCVPDL
jgi:hypothetical protein